MITPENMKMHDEFGEKLASKMNLFQLTSQLKHSAKAIPKLKVKKYNWWNESLHGVARAGVATVFPQAIAMASTFSDEMMFQVAQIIATEARAKYNENQKKRDFGIYKGLTMWSPNINIYRDSRWGRGHETYGEDPYLTGKLGVAFIKGLQGDDEKYLKASACAKHFAVHSGPEAKRHSFNAVVSKKDMFETYLPAFEEAVRDGKVSGVMGAYNRTNDEACCASPTLMQKLLREHWGFKGYYVSDCGALLDIVFNHKLTKNPYKGAAMALKAGCDLECGVLYTSLPISAMLGYVKKKDLKKSVSRLMSIRSQLGMFDEDCVFNKIAPQENASKENEDFAIKVAEKGIVLLENDGTLPLKKNEQKILITGYNSDNELAYLGNYFGDPSSYVKIFDAVKKYNKDTKHTQGVHLYNEAENKDKDETIKIAKGSDIVFFCTGLDSSIEGEEAGGMLAGGGGKLGVQGDRITLELPDTQQQLMDELVKLGKKIVILNFSGGCVNLKKYKDNVNAIIQCWYPGGKGGQAIANIVFGEISPSGKLPITFYNSVDDLPDFEDYSMKNRTYKYFKNEVQYPFGYGLTYTDFELVGAEFDKGKMQMNITVKNIGDFDSDEVFQIYTTYPKQSYETPLKSLIKFKRIHLKQGEQTTVSLNFNESDFYSIDEDGNKVFTKGIYNLIIQDGQNINDSSLTFTNENDDLIVEKCPI